MPGLAVFHHASLRAFAGGQRPPLEAGTQKEAISAFYTDAMKSNLLRDPVPGARQEAPQSSALRLCRSAALRPSTPLIAPFQGWGTPPLALAAPAGVGQGRVPTFGPFRLTAKASGGTGDTCTECAI